MADDTKEGLENSLLVFVKRVCDEKSSATPAELEAMPKVAELLLEYF